MDAATARSVLGVSEGIDKEQLKKAYRRLVRATHPDRNPGNKVAEEKFKRVQAAYELLEKTAPEPRQAPDPTDPVEIRYQQILRDVEEQAERVRRETAADEARFTRERAQTAAQAEDSFSALLHDLAEQASEGARRLINRDIPLGDSVRSASAALKERIAAGLSDLDSAATTESQTAEERELDHVKKLIRRYTDPVEPPSSFDVRG